MNNTKEGRRNIIDNKKKHRTYLIIGIIILIAIVLGIFFYLNSKGVFSGVFSKESSPSTPEPSEIDEPFMDEELPPTPEPSEIDEPFMDEELPPTPEPSISDSPKKTTPNFVIQELENLDIQTEEYTRYDQVYLPEDLSNSSQWSLIETICEEGGYDLNEYANEFVDLYSYSSDRYYEEIQLNVIVLADDENVIGVYFSAGPEGPVPGVFSIKDSNLIRK